RPRCREPRRLRTARPTRSPPCPLPEGEGGRSATPRAPHPTPLPGGEGERSALSVSLSLRERVGARALAAPRLRAPPASSAARSTRAQLPARESPPALRATPCTARALARPARLRPRATAPAGSAHLREAAIDRARGGPTTPRGASLASGCAHREPPN